MVSHVRYGLTAASAENSNGQTKSCGLTKRITCGLDTNAFSN